MTTLTEFLTESADYIDDASRAVLEGLTEEQFACLVAASEEAWGPEPGVDNDLVSTTETIADFDAARAAHWAGCARREELDVGAPAVKFEGVQIFRGATRTDLVVVDLGPRRVVLK